MTLEQFEKAIGCMPLDLIDKSFATKHALYAIMRNGTKQVLNSVTHEVSWYKDGHVEVAMLGYICAFFYVDSVESIVFD